MPHGNGNFARILQVFWLSKLLCECYLIKFTIKMWGLRRTNYTPQIFIAVYEKTNMLIEKRTLNSSRKCVNFTKLKLFIILHSHALNWHLIFTHLLLWVSLFEHETFMYTHISFSSRSRVTYFRWIYSTTANSTHNSNKVSWLLYVGIDFMWYFCYKYWYNFLWEGKSVSPFQ